MHLAELFKLSKKELSKISKSELIETITGQYYEWNGKISTIKDLTEKVTNQKADERAACLLLESFMEGKVPRTEYGNTVDSQDLNLIELIGKVLRYVSDK